MVEPKRMGRGSTPKKNVSCRDREVPTKTLGTSFHVLGWMWLPPAGRVLTAGTQTARRQSATEEFDTRRKAPAEAKKWPLSLLRFFREPVCPRKENSLRQRFIHLNQSRSNVHLNVQSCLHTQFAKLHRQFAKKNNKKPPRFSCHEVRRTDIVQQFVGVRQCEHTHLALQNLFKQGVAALP